MSVADKTDDLSDWLVRIRPVPADVPAAVRVKRFLKAALRAYGLKCEGIQAVAPDRATDANVAKSGAGATE